MQALTAYSTLALAIVAVLALWAAWGQIDEARRLRKATNRPYVVVHVEGDKSTRTLNLVLENSGNTVAKNVTITFSPPLAAAHKIIDHGETAKFWEQPTMPPGKVLRTVLDHGPDRVDSDLPMAYDVRITYDSPATDEIKITDNYRIDLQASVYAVRQWDKVDQDTPKQTRALQSIADSLKKIEPPRYGPPDAPEMSPGE